MAEKKSKQTEGVKAKSKMPDKFKKEPDNAAYGEYTPSADDFLNVTASNPSGKQ